MTTIVAVQGDGWAVVGYDSQVSEIDIGGRTYTLPKSNSKVVKNGDYLIGSAGDLRILNILSYVFKPPSVQIANLDKHMTTSFIPALKKCLEDNSVSKDGQYESEIMVAVRGQVYIIGEQYEWCQDVKGIYAIGSGNSYALGALYNEARTKDFTSDPDLAKVAVKSALEISASLDWGTGLPISVLLQKKP